LRWLWLVEFVAIHAALLRIVHLLLLWGWHRSYACFDRSGPAQLSKKRRNVRTRTPLSAPGKPALKGAESMSKMPPVPPEQRSNKGPGSDPNVVIEDKIPGRENFDTQGRHGNIKQNTTNQGYQQDR
jgi:hypothetical protein